MAVDEAIFEAFIAGNAPPTIRFYGWDGPAVTVGRLQPISSVPEGWGRGIAAIDLSKGGSGDPRITPAGRIANPSRTNGTAHAGGIANPSRARAVVRRPTGGRAVLHGNDLTFSLVVSSAELGSPVRESYRRVAQCAARALASLGVKAEFCRNTTVARAVRSIGNCFDLTLDYELSVEGAKVLGSAQVRRSGAVLQQTSLVYAGAAWPERGALSDAIVREIGAEFTVETSFGDISSDEHQNACRLAENKYATDEWNLGKRTVGASFEEDRSPDHHAS